MKTNSDLAFLSLDCFFFWFFCLLFCVCIHPKQNFVESYSDGKITTMKLGMIMMELSFYMISYFPLTERAASEVCSKVIYLVGRYLFSDKVFPCANVLHLG